MPHPGAHEIVLLLDASKTVLLEALAEFQCDLHVLQLDKGPKNPDARSRHD